MATQDDYTLQVFIENEAGSATKNTFDERTLQFQMRQTVSCAYPFPYGFVLGTTSGDGDCVDCFVVSNARLRSGDIVKCCPVHLLEQIEDGEIDHKVLCRLIGEFDTIAEQDIASIRTFLGNVFAHVPGKRLRTGALRDADDAMTFIRRCLTTD